MAPKQTYDVVIVGGGPVGLFLGICLQQMEISFRILEKRPEPVTHSRSLGIHPVSLELFRKLEIDREFLDAGIKIKNGIAYTDRGRVGSISFETGPGPHPYILSLPQYKTEQLLSDRLQQAAPTSLVRGATVTDLTFKDHDTLVHYRKDGTEHQLRTSYVIGCDGKDSMVRQSLAIPFHGEAYPDTYIMGDFSDNTIFEEDAVVFLDHEGLIESFPLPGGMRRWVVKTQEYIPEPTRFDIERRVAHRIGHDLGEEEQVMISSFGVQKLLVDQMGSGRGWLAGDAAHVVSPIGGQGMNLGWLDAWELSQALKQIVKEQQEPGPLLSTYDRKRRKAARKAVRRAEFNMKLGRKTRLSRLKHLAVWLMLHSPVKHYLRKLFTMRGLQ